MRSKIIVSMNSKKTMQLNLEQQCEILHKKMDGELQNNIMKLVGNDLYDYSHNSVKITNGHPTEISDSKFEDGEFFAIHFIKGHMSMHPDMPNNKI